ncbi:DUF6491 family protein [Coralloluteibacterium stylophorae]|uniref:Lipoprotein n=1 Tax=Coralloluteibacterium stylophorae TaxID=1776034 RepID=A0A8J8AY33_9GAMM|nr:DUF6491 family protein [Coralloluteibacterium stylophorae]MBS7456164.1 hypothetical protein [Coralloluteibacterium stylophorae]
MPLRASTRAARALPLVLSATIAVAAGCSSISPRDRDAARLAEYEAAAGAPVDSFRYFSLSSWEPLGDRALAVHTSPRQAWLLEVSGPCNELPYTPAIGLTSSVNTVSARFDSVLTGRREIPCRIERIRPVDVAQLREIARRSDDMQRTVEARERPATLGQDAEG